MTGGRPGRGRQASPPDRPEEKREGTSDAGGSADPHGPPRWALLWLAVLLLTLPHRFRDRFGAEMEETFRERWRAVSDPAHGRGAGVAASAALLFRTTLDLLATALRERARPTFGPPPRSTRRLPLMDWLLQDLRFAVRSLLRRPGFTAVAIVTLALGVGANTAIFSVVNGVLLRPLPWPDQDRIVTVGNPTYQGAMSRPDLLDLDAAGSFERVIGLSPTDDALTGLGDAEAIEVARVTSGVLGVFGLEPHLGRDLTLDDTRAGATEVAVVSHDFWAQRLGGDPDAVGRTIELRGRPHRVVGVAPPGFSYPAVVQVWRPFGEDAGCQRDCYTYGGLARLAEGVTMDAAQAEADGIATRLQTAYPDTNGATTFRLVSLVEHEVGGVRQGLWILLGAVAFVLLIACANVANLLLARSQTRTGEVAVRAALGAGRGRLASQVLAESAVLAGAGGAAGLLVALGGVELLRRMGTGTVPRIAEIGVDGTVLAFTLGVTALVGLLFGLGPALRESGGSPAARMVASSARAGGSRIDARSRSALLVGEVALALVLLTGAGLLLKSFARLYAIQPGYETRGILRFSLALPDPAYPDLTSMSAFYRTLEERLAAEPGVLSVGSAFGPPLGQGLTGGTVLVEGRPEPEPDGGTGAWLKPVTPGFLGTMGIAVLRGRGIEPSDDEGALPVALVNETFVRENFPGEEALGRRVRITAHFGYANPTWTIVGVVPDLRTRSLAGAPEAEIFVPQAQFGPGAMTVTLRLAEGTSVAAVADRLRPVVRELDPNLPVRAVETIEEAVGRELASTRFFLSLIGLFSALGLVLAGTGLYGVAAFLASRRRREMGIRIALGAKRAEIVSLMLGSGLRPALLGVALGLAGAWTATRWLERLLYEVEARDPLVYAGVAALLVGVVVLASLLPAREASRVDPVEALRTD